MVSISPIQTILFLQQSHLSHLHFSHTQFTCGRSKMALAFANNGEFSRPFFSSLAQASDTLVTRSNVRAISSLLYSYGLSGLISEGGGLVSRLWNRATQLEQAGLSFESESLTQLYLFIVACRLEAPEECDFSLVESSSLFNSIHEAARIRESQEPSEEKKRNVKEMSEALRSLEREGFLGKIKQAGELEVNLIRPDIDSFGFNFLATDVISVGSDKIAIEFSSPTDCTKRLSIDSRTGERRVHLLESGNMKFRRRMWERMGWYFYTINSAEWLRAKVLASSEEHRCILQLQILFRTLFGKGNPSPPQSQSLPQSQPQPPPQSLSHSSPHPQIPHQSHTSSSTTTRTAEKFNSHLDFASDY